MEEPGVFQPPFVVWTMQRSGGTSFASLLDIMSEGETTHEPFSGPNAAGPWAAEKAAMASGQVVGKAQTHNIKHCYELCAHSFNETLFKTVSARGSFSVHLLRRNILAQVESLALAQTTNVYGAAKASEIYPEVLCGAVKLPPLDLGWYSEHIRRILTWQRNMSSILAENGVPFVYFEDIFSGSENDICQKFEAAVDVLNAAGGSFRQTPKYQARKNSYFGRDQNSRSVVDHIPNIADLRDMVLEAAA